jgi:hypothetical protein
LAVFSWQLAIALLPTENRQFIFYLPASANNYPSSVNQIRFAAPKFCFCVSFELALHAGKAACRKNNHT